MSPPGHDQLPTGDAARAAPLGSLHLDTRQRAMLAEMKIPVWWPQVAAEPQPSSVLVDTASARATPVRPRAGAQAPPLSGASAAARQAVVPVVASGVDIGAGGAVERMDWAGLRETVHGCSACGLCEGRKAPVFVADPVPAQADWLIVGDPPDEHEERAGVPFVGPAGQLLDNMLRAVGLTRDGSGKAGARLTPVVKCRPQAPRNPTADELAQCAVYLHREIALTQPRIIVAMGRFAALSLLGREHPELLRLPFGQLRGTVYRCMGIPVVVTYPPSKLLRAPLQKAQAWADLCLARAQATAASAFMPP